MTKDFRYAARSLGRSPGFTLFVAGFLMLGIGGVTTVFSFFHAVLLRPLSASEPETLVRIEQHLPRVGAISSFPIAYYEAVRSRATSLAFAIGQAGEFEHYTVTAPAPAQDIALRGVTPNFFEALGVRPLYGRVLDAADERRVSEPVAVLSYRFWQRRFGNDSGVLTTKLAVNGRYVSVVGVMPQTFGGTTTDTSPDLWMPLSAYMTWLSAEDRATVMLDIAGRLKPGSTQAHAESECRTIWQSMMADYYTGVEHLSGKDPIGKRFGLPVDGVASARYQIVGVVGDAKYRSLREPVPATFFWLGAPTGTFVLNVRANTHPHTVIEPIQRALAAIDPTLPFREVHTMREEVANSMARERLTAALAASVGICAALFTGAGIYGALAFAATHRRREIAIRTALGARGVQTAMTIGGRTIVMVASGILVGIAGASAASALIRSMLFNISPQDPPAVTAAVMFVVCVAFVATAWPLRRAIRNEPAEILRQEQ